LTVEEMKRAIEGTAVSMESLRERLPLAKNEVIHQLQIQIDAGTFDGDSDARQ